ncbi:MAG: beta-N-acetylhexosaminidase [Bacteroidaceae bacterium]|nr:beta-N-acetylhexosaminidase [Bacteroidaceae bacterium]
MPTNTSEKQLENIFVSYLLDKQLFEGLNRKCLLSSFVLLLLFFQSSICCLWATPKDVNLTPWPMELTTTGGEYVLPRTLLICTMGLNDDQQKEVTRFATELCRVTGLKVKWTARQRADMTVRVDDSVTDPEGYRLQVTKKGITVYASTATGIFYALQSLRKMLPAHVAAGVPRLGERCSLPFVGINDAPRFRYRGFMLDVSRHFFTTQEIKKLLSLMALYKMNHFHWHLTDDQGWRVEIRKYPRLTTVGAVRENSWNTELERGSYWTGETYGPYFYTQDDIRDVVAYADSLHITVVPEVEMPGHLSAVMAAYPEFSCDPGGGHRVWTDGGISTDVLNVANPAAVQFACDVLTELAPLFPGELFHVGGDETPTTAWENNELCKKVFQEEQMTSYSQLQSRFTRQLAEHLHSLGKRICVWNEAITAPGADMQLIRSSGATVFCWNPCQDGARKAAEAGLPAIISNWGQDGCYYINRRACSKDFGAGRGGDNLQKMYDYLPVPDDVPAELHPHYIGVQATFWTEHVSNTDHLEHLALPRLIGMAEIGWTPQALRSFPHFVERMKQDTAYLRLAGFRYHPQYLDYDGPEPPEN